MLDIRGFLVLRYDMSFSPTLIGFGRRRPASPRCWLNRRGGVNTKSAFCRRTKSWYIIESVWSLSFFLPAPPGGSKKNDKNGRCTYAWSLYTRRFAARVAFTARYARSDRQCRTIVRLELESMIDCKCKLATRKRQEPRHRAPGKQPGRYLRG